MSRLRSHRFRLNVTNIEEAIIREKKPWWTILEEQFPVPRNTAASKKKGNGVISLLWQLRCHGNLIITKFSSLSNTAVVNNISKSLIMPKIGRYWPWKPVSSHLKV